MKLRGDFVGRIVIETFAAVDDIDVSEKTAILKALAEWNSAPKSNRPQWAITICKDSNLLGAYILIATERNATNPQKLCLRDSMTMVELEMMHLTDANFEQVKATLERENCTSFGTLIATRIRMHELGFDHCGESQL